MLIEEEAGWAKVDLVLSYHESDSTKRLTLVWRLTLVFCISSCVTPKSTFSMCLLSHSNTQYVTKPPNTYTQHFVCTYFTFGRSQVLFPVV